MEWLAKILFSTILEVKRLISIFALVEKFSHFGVDLHQNFESICKDIGSKNYDAKLPKRANLSIK